MYCPFMLQWLSYTVAISFSDSVGPYHARGLSQDFF